MKMILILVCEWTFYFQILLKYYCTFRVILPQPGYKSFILPLYPRSTVAG